MRQRNSYFKILIPLKFGSKKRHGVRPNILRDKDYHLYECLLTGELRYGRAVIRCGLHGMRPDL